jgi:heme-degrading monooxygenase HmoA
VDVWESKEHFEAFFRDRLRAALEAEGMAIGEPKVFELHALFAVGTGMPA